MRNGTAILIALSACLPSIAQAPKGPQIKPLKGAEGTYLCTALSADGKRLVVGARDGSVTLWDALTRNELHVMTGHKGTVLAVAFDPKHQFIVSVGVDRTVRVWTLDGKEKVKPISTRNDAATCVAVSTDGKRIAYGGWDRAVHQVNAENGEPIGEKPSEQSTVFSLAYSPDGKWLATGGRRGTVQIWEATNELKHHATLPDHGKSVWAVAWSPDSTTLAASADHAVRLWNVADKKVIEDLKGHIAPIRALTFTDGGKKVISGSDDKTAKIWDIAKKQAVTLTGANASVMGVAASADGKTIYAVSDEAVQSARVFVLGKD